MCVYVSPTSILLALSRCVLHGKSTKSKKLVQKKSPNHGEKGLDTESIAPTPPIPPGDRRNVLKTPCLERDVLPTHTHPRLLRSLAMSQWLLLAFVFISSLGVNVKKLQSPSTGFTCAWVCVCLYVCADAVCLPLQRQRANALGQYFARFC